MTIHCPSDTLDLITDRNNYVKRGQISNFALYYRYFLDESDNKFGMQAQKSQEALEFVQDFADPQKVFTGQNSILENLRNRQTDQFQYLASSGEWLAPGHFYCAISRLNWRLVVGIGSEHVQETNMTLDHIYGIPYLPGSAFKGILRSWVIQEYFKNDEKLAVRDIKDRDSADLKQKKEDFFTVFGSQKTAGKVRFLDTLPAQNFHFELDIMNPHFSKYYTGSEFPTDDQQLNPISFLTLKEVPFRFLIYSKTAAPLDLAKNWFAEAIANLGFGAKSGVGYGYFSELNDITDKLKYEFAEKLSLDKAHNIYHSDSNRWESIYIDIEPFVGYAPKFAVIVVEGICEVESIGGINEIPETLIKTEAGIVVPSEFGKWVWEKIKNELFEEELPPFPNLVYRSEFKRTPGNLTVEQRKLLQEELLQIAVDFRRTLNRFLSDDDRELLQKRLLQVVDDLEKGNIFERLTQNERASLAERLFDIAEDSENDGVVPDSVDVEGGRTIECGGTDNGKLVLRTYTNQY